MDGNANSLKERTLATDVFDRPASWDSGEDTIVRGGAREVRKRLAQYYASPEGMHERVRFELAPGSYVPVFVHVDSIDAPPPLPITQPAAFEIETIRSKPQPAKPGMSGSPGSRQPDWSSQWQP